MRRVFYAADPPSAKRALERFNGKWKAMYPDAVKCLARNFEAEPFPPVAGFHLIWPGERFDVATAVAVVSAELGDAERRAAIVHQLLHVLGLRGDSGVFPESATFSEAERRSTATALAPIDRRLLRLLYMNLEPADGWSELRTAYRRYWHAS